MTSRDIRRKFGQNYLKDISILLKMADVISPSSSDNFLEIGPGHGALTEQLNREKISIIGVDIDKNNIEILKNKFTGPANFKFIADDILNYKIINSRQRIVGNLPYNISTQIILKLIDNCEQIVDVHFLVQKEVAEKIAGKVGTKNWGKLAIKIATFFNCEILFNVPPDAFDIKPKVESSFIRVMPKKDIDYDLSIKEQLFKVIDLAFSSRRKNIKNNLKNLNIDWKELDINPTKRPEEISLNQFIKITKGQHS